MSLKSLLPAPLNKTYDRDDEKTVVRVNLGALQNAKSTAPPYGQRRGFVPRSENDFGDGGAYPEIQVAQYPLDMGAPSNAGKKSNALALQTDANGKVKYDLIARQGHGKDKIVYSNISQLLPAEVLSEDAEELQRPTDDDIADLTESTRAALEKLTNQKISAALPLRAAEKAAPAQYIRYTPAQQGNGEFNSGAKQRVIRMVEAQVDPIEPPRFKTSKKVPRGPPSPPAPVLHSPSRKVSVKEQKEWKVPPCISNWKNAKGYTIPLDKRLAADGRGLQQVHINEKFAKMAEALYIADRKAREAVEARAQLEKKLAQKEKEKKEDELRAMAQRAREERNGIRFGADEDTSEAVRERDEIREARHRERARDRNLARAAPDKRTKLQKDRERDISEQIALGMPAKTQFTGESAFDQRLFNTSKGMDSGYGDDEAYNVYDKPWREGGSLANHIYRPSKQVDSDIYGGDLDKIVNTNRFVPDKDFAGADRSGQTQRSGPVQFEKEDDIFQLDKFLDTAKKGSKRKDDGASTSKSSDHSSDKKRRRD